MCESEEMLCDTKRFPLFFFHEEVMGSRPVSLALNGGFFDNDLLLNCDPVAVTGGCLAF
jgi:hypothetical protein